ncbi:MAG TPA: NTP transferase domain-containing protein [Acidimicrobiales bacterium]|nr:NTP transferase domain-containing protein [Acidimicrobiales bacterium]
MTEAFSGVVLTGGRSRRMGTDKAALFGARVAAALHAAGASEVFEVGADDEPGNGPLGGIATALRRARNDVVVVLACDLPDVRPEGIRAVVDALTGDRAADVALPPGEPLHAAWRRTARPAVLAAIGARTLAVRAVLDRLRVVEVAGIDPAWLRNVNTPADLVQTLPVADPTVPEIDIDEMIRRRADGAYLLDVRNPAEYEEAHVPGAVLIPLGDLGERWQEVPDGDVLVICRSGARSARAVEALNGAGRTTVNVAGGTQAWIEAGHPVVAGPEPA